MGADMAGAEAPLAFVAEEPRRQSGQAATASAAQKSADRTQQTAEATLIAGRVGVTLQKWHHLRKEGLDLRRVEPGLPGHGINHFFRDAAGSRMLHHTLKNRLGLIGSDASLAGRVGQSVAAADARKNASKVHGLTFSIARPI